MNGKRLFNFNMPIEIYDYLYNISKSNFTTMSQYIINLILEDRRKNNVIQVFPKKENDNNGI